MSDPLSHRPLLQALAILVLLTAAGACGDKDDTGSSADAGPFDCESCQLTNHDGCLTNVYMAGDDDLGGTYVLPCDWSESDGEAVEPQWTATLVGSDKVKLQNSQGDCLVGVEEPGDIGELGTYPCDSYDEPGWTITNEWTFAENDDGTVTLKSDSGACLSYQDSGEIDDDDLMVLDCDFADPDYPLYTTWTVSAPG